MERARTLRKLIAGEELIVVPGIYDALTSKIAQYCGFQALFMTGYGTAASYGYPDIGLLTMHEMAENVKRISESVQLPLIADADTGYGNYTNVYRTVREYEKAGAAAIQIEDQTWPKRCGYMAGKDVIDASEMVGKIKAAVDARINPETVVIARSDACGVHGFDDAINRGHLYIEAGADILLVEAVSNLEQLREVPKAVSKPCIINMGFIEKLTSLAEVTEMGFRVALYPVVALDGAIQGAFRACKFLLEKGRQIEAEDVPFHYDELNRLLGLGEYKDLEKKVS